MVLCDDYYFDDLNTSKIKQEDLFVWDICPFGLEQNGFATVWDEDNFAILVTNKYKNELKMLYDAFCNLEVTIGMAPAEIFNNGGLMLCIKSNFPKETIDKIRKADLDYLNLKKAVEETNIKEILKKTGKKYFALSPG